MKKHLDYLFLLAPALVWWLSSAFLGDQFHMPNRLMLAVLCTAAGAGALLTHRKMPGVLALVAGLAMLASVPVQHEVPESMLTLRLSGIDLSRQPAATQVQTVEAIQGTGTDWIALKTNGSSHDLASHAAASHPYRYTSCGGHRELISRHPMSGVQEVHKMGAVQLSGQLEAGDTSIGFVIIDLSGTRNEADARDLIAEVLQPSHMARVALLDTGETGHRIPLEWITYTTGFARSQRPWTSFTGSFSLDHDNPRQMMLFSPQLRCRAFAETAMDSPSVAGTYVVGS